MNVRQSHRIRLLFSLALACTLVACGKKGGGTDVPGVQGASTGVVQWPRDGSRDKPLEVMLIPADGGTEGGTKADFLPLFNAITETQGLFFDVRVGQSYSAVVEAMASEPAQQWLESLADKQAAGVHDEEFQRLEDG